MPAIREKGLTQRQAVAVLGVDQPKVPALMRGRITGVTIERSLRHLTKSGNDVEIIIRPTDAAYRHGTVRVRDGVAIAG